MTNLTKLEALARAATQGEWEHRSTDIEYVVVDVIDVSRVRRKEGAAYIAAANPSAILALIKRVRAAEAKEQTMYTNVLAAIVTLLVTLIMLKLVYG